MVLGLSLSQDAQQNQTEGENVVEIRMVTENGEYFFDPIGVRVEPGTTIRFINESDVHSSTAYSEENGKPRRIPENAESWDSGILAEVGAGFEVTLTEEGVYDYFCIPHEMLAMVGRIVVGDGEAAAAQEQEELDNMDILSTLPSVEQIVTEGVVNYEQQQ